MERITAMFRRAATMWVVFQRSEPCRPTRRAAHEVRLIINLKIAKAFGFDIAATLLPVPTR
jgi:hypothetical protein